MANTRQDESFFDRLTRLFRSGPSIRRKIKGYDNPSYYDKRAARMNAAGSGMLPIRKGVSQLSVLGGSDMMSRMGRYTDFVNMEFTPICSKAMDIIADEVCSGDEKGKNLHIYSDNLQIKNALIELFYDVLNVDFDLRVWVRNLVKYGDVFILKEVAPGLGILAASSMAVDEVEREEGFDADDPYATRFKWHRYGQKYLEAWQVSHFRILGNDLYAPYGVSVLDSARLIWQKYTMMVDAMLIYRLTRAPERRVFYIDVGTVAPNDIPTYMQTVMGTIRGNQVVDKATGRMDERFNPIAIDEDYVVPVRGSNSGTKIDNLPGGQNATATEDIELVQNQLFAALGVPKPFLGFDDNLSSKATLSMEDIRFSKSVQILQKIIVSELNKMAILHLYAKGFDGEDLINFELKLSNPSTIALQQKMDLWKSKVDIVSAIDQIKTPFLSMDLIYKDLFGYTEDEIGTIREQLKKDKKFAAELNAITEPDKPSENLVDPFDPAHYSLPGGMTPEAPLSTTMPTNGDSDGAPLSFSLSPNQTPIKDNPNVRQDQKNQKRRKSSLEKQSAHTDFRAMLNPSKNLSLRDVYDQDFLKNPLKEENNLRQEIFGSTKNAYLSREIKSLLENFDKATKPPTPSVMVESTTDFMIPINDDPLDELFSAATHSPQDSEETVSLKDLGIDLLDDGEGDPEEITLTTLTTTEKNLG